MEELEKYTLGIYFDPNLEKIALILKKRPNWQAGKYNFPGGHIEENEAGVDCIVREFYEECGIKTTFNNWKLIAIMHNHIAYTVEIFTAIHNPESGDLRTMEDQEVSWFEINNLPENLISNLKWLIYFALNYWQQGNFDFLTFGIFEYKFNEPEHMKVTD